MSGSDHHRRTVNELNAFGLCSSEPFRSDIARWPGSLKTISTLGATVIDAAFGIPMRIAIYDSDPLRVDQLDYLLSSADHRIFIESSRGNLTTLLRRSTMDLIITEWQVSSREFAAFQAFLRAQKDGAPLIFLIEPKTRIYPANQSYGSRLVSFVSFPTPVRGFLEEIKRVQLQAYPKCYDSEFSVGVYRLDILSRKVYFEDNPLSSLDSTAFRLAYCLFANVNRPLSRDYLEHFVAGAAVNGHTRYIDNVIGRVKTVLGLRQNGEIWIRTIRGYGYVLEWRIAPSEVSADRASCHDAGFGKVEAPRPYSWRGKYTGHKKK